MSLKPRPLPRETLDSLRPPAAAFPYFAHAERFPFEPGAAGQSGINAWWLADACLLVYGDAAFVDAAFGQSPLPQQGWQLGWLGTRGENRGISLSHEGALVVIFRGTRLEVYAPFEAAELVLINQDDLWVDSQFLPAVWKTGGRVHAGFLKAFAEISDSLDAALAARQPDQPLWLAGHSLGGALANLAAAHVGPSSVRALYTYGCPRVGDAAFIRALSVQDHQRFVHGDDWVPTIPPRMLGYVHAGVTRRVPGGPDRQNWDLWRSGGELVAALTAMAKRLRLDTGELPVKISGLVDHAPIYYATLLWNALLAEQAT